MYFAAPKPAKQEKKEEPPPKKKKKKEPQPTLLEEIEKELSKEIPREPPEVCIQNTLSGVHRHNEDHHTFAGVVF